MADRYAPRKRPRQERARLTFDSIVEAADQLITSGAESTTNHIAERAGVSIGTLYQYFPDRDSILATMIERDIRAMSQRLIAKLAQPAENTLQALSDAMVDALIDEYRSRPTYYARVIPDVSRLERMGYLEQESARATQMIHATLAMQEAHHPMDDETRQVVSFIAARMVNSAVHSAVMERPELLESEIFVRELKRLASSYLFQSRAD